MCIDLNLFDNPILLKQKYLVSLPAGFTKMVHHIGNVILNSKITLTPTLYIPNYKFSLLYVNKLTKNACINLSFNLPVVFLGTFRLKKLWPLVES